LSHAPPLADESKRASVEAAAHSKQANLAGGYAGVDDVSTVFSPAPTPSSSSSSVRRRSGSLLDGGDEPPLSNTAVHATQSQRSLMPEEGCEIDMSQIKFMEERGEGAFGKVFHCLLWEVRTRRVVTILTLIRNRKTLL
jgi:hypothetical protein